MPQFYCVIGNRDHLKIKDKSGKVMRQAPVWEFITDQNHWLTSLIYANGVKSPPGHRLFDCGAWTYKHERLPKWTSVQCIEQYQQYAAPGDVVTAPDHMVLRGHSWAEESHRVLLTLREAQEFIKHCPQKWTPMAVTHGNRLEVRINMAKRLLDMGYRYLAIGGVAGRAGARKQVREILEAMAALKHEGDLKIHVLGVSALSWLPVYRELGIDTFDGSSMFYAAFTGATYYWPDPDAISGVSKYSVKELPPEKIPLCHCPACVAMRKQGDDTRTMGSNERNMGRAVHNINIYLEVLKTRLNAA